MNCYLCGDNHLSVAADTLRNGPGSVFYCGACDLAQLSTGGGALDQYYDGEYRELHGPRLGQRATGAELFDAYVNYQASRVELLRPWLRPDFRLLEVGCSTGYFLYHVRDLVAEVVGVDFDADAARVAGDKCRCRTFGGALSSAGLAQASFDVVCALQTLEHVPDPIAFVRDIGSYLKPGGVLYIEVPNLADPLRSLYGNTAYERFYFHEAHLFYFSAKSLLTVMRRAGFDGRVYPTQTYNFVNHLHWALCGTPQATCHDGLSVPQLPLAVHADDSCRAALSTWAAAADRDYKAILARHGATDDLAYIGTQATT